MAPEPTDVGPMYGGHLRVSDADRGQAIRLLDAALADGRLTADDHAQRRTDAQAAVTFDDIVPITRDLVATADVVAAQRSQELLPRESAPVPAATGANLSPMWQVGILSGITRKGAWQVPSKVNAIAFWGGVTLDLTEAVWSSDTIELNVLALMGGIEVVVPPDVEVRDQCVAFLGGVEVSSKAATGRRQLVVKGLASLGGVTVKTPKRRRQ